MSSERRRGKPGSEPGERNRDVEVGTLVAQPHGGALRHGSKPGTNGGGGRIPDEFRRRMRELLTRDRTLDYLTECLDGIHGPMVFLRAFEYGTDWVYGKPPSSPKGTGDTEPLVVIVRHGGEGA